MDLSNSDTTPKQKPAGRFRKFISPVLSSPYRSPLLSQVIQDKNSRSDDSTLEDFKKSSSDLLQKNEILERCTSNIPDRKTTSPHMPLPFRSPLLSKEVRGGSKITDNITMEDLKKSSLHLLEKNEMLEIHIKELEDKGLKEDQLQWYIDRLHEYNEIKDVAQLVMGEIAILEQTTTRKIHEEFGMTDED